MRSTAYGVWRPGLLALALVAGCSGNAGPTEEAMRGRFAELQAAIKAGDTDQLWDLLAARSQADAEREASAAKDAYAAANAGKKAELEEAYGLGGAEFASLTGKGYLKTKPCKRKHGELVGSTVTSVVLEKDSATVYYTEPDDDKEKLRLVREGGRWKAWLTIPKPKPKPKQP
jgi:hypothetical protein